MVPSACSDECARGAEGEAKARLRDLEAAPRPEKHAGTRHTHLTDIPHRRRSPRACVAHLGHLRTQ